MAQNFTTLAQLLFWVTKVKWVDIVIIARKNVYCLSKVSYALNMKGNEELHSLQASKTKPECQSRYALAQYLVIKTQDYFVGKIFANDENLFDG